MNREELFASIVAARPDREDTVYLERRGGFLQLADHAPGRHRHRDAVVPVENHAAPGGNEWRGRIAATMAASQKETSPLRWRLMAERRSCSRRCSIA